jgi:hypothetical protein
VLTYRTLVSDSRIPLWHNKRLRSAGASIPHLYTSVRTPDDPDAIERWLHKEFEQPQIPPLSD